MIGSGLEISSLKNQSPVLEGRIESMAENGETKFHKNVLLQFCTIPKCSE